MSTERIISIYSSRGGAKKIVTGASEEKLSADGMTLSTTTVVSIWGELLPLVKKLNYPVSDLHVSENIRKSTLEHVDAVLPDGEFTLFMRPKKTKSGAKAKRADGLNKKELISLIKEDIASSDNGKAYYNGYSSKSVADLAGLVNKFKAKVAPAPKETKAKATPATKAKTQPKKVAAPVKKAVGKVVESVAESKVKEETPAELNARLAKDAAIFEKGLR